MIKTTTQTMVVNEELIENIKKQLEVRWKTTDYTIATLSNFIQQAIEQYCQGKLTLPDGLGLKGMRKTISVRLTEQQRKWYQNLTRGRKGIIIDKVLLAYQARI